MEVVKLWDKVTWWAKFNKIYKLKKGTIGTVDGRRASKSSFPNKMSRHNEFQTYGF
jgi:hypothetical protein